VKHYQQVQAWVRELDAGALVVLLERSLGKKVLDVAGNGKCPVTERYAVHKVLPRASQSLAEMQKLQNSLTIGANAPVFGEKCSFLAEKTQLAKVLPGNNGVYQISLQATYMKNLEDENGED
jgi:hypothetical protein